MPRSFRRVLQFRLRSVLVMTTLSAVALAWYSYTHRLDEYDQVFWKLRMRIRSARSVNVFRTDAATRVPRTVSFFAVTSQHSLIQLSRASNWPRPERLFEGVAMSTTGDRFIVIIDMPSGAYYWFVLYGDVLYVLENNRWLLASGHYAELSEQLNTLYQRAVQRKSAVWLRTKDDVRRIFQQHFGIPQPDSVEKAAKKGNEPQANVRTH